MRMSEQTFSQDAVDPMRPSRDVPTLPGSKVARGIDYEALARALLPRIKERLRQEGERRL